MNAQLRTLLAGHDGVVTRSQALDVGLSSSAIGRLVDSGTWTRVGNGVYFATDRDMSHRARMRIACARAGTRSVLSGASAAWWHRIEPRPPRTITVTTPRTRHATELPGMQILLRDLRSEDVVERANLRVTSVPLTVLDAAAVTGSKVLDSALLRGQVSLEQLIAAHRRYPGRRGATASERMLNAAASGARSEAERILVRLLRGSGISGWVANQTVCGYPVDVMFAEQKVIVEIDGMAFHSDAEAFQHDRTRQNVLVANGWTILRFTWADLTDRPHHVVAQIRAIVSRVSR
ncbi:DUF559 domain-containing protein [Williamsia sp.]|uniref:DUF559 domain-containing protein n=1 Tax=Williamsia sp. TaxID=1872085 RepID=UPI001A3245DF|nr:DUF559 domain-containing protein [Williamsia sp.]MBJ7287900.1 DUF559 domain-containing protein [Williamsia sp.]